MNAAVMIETCPDAETLAAFSDGLLDEQSRLEVIRHLADCGQCQHELIELDAAKQELGTDTGKELLQVEDKAMGHAAKDVREDAGSPVEHAPAVVAARSAEPRGAVVRGRFASRVVRPLSAAAAVMALLFGVAPIRDRLLGSGMTALVKAAEGLPKRTTAARLSGDFSYKEFPVLRGGADDADLTEIKVKSAALKAAERAAKKPTPANLHTAGVGHILTKNNNEAVKDLERAANTNPESAAIQSDLAAAYIARARDGDYERALTTVTKSLSIEQTPAAAWNRALALQVLGRDAEAIAAWEKYLSLDPNSPWATEARRRIEGLRGP